MKVTLGTLVVEKAPTAPTKFKLIDLENWYSGPTLRTTVTDLPEGDGAFNPGRSWRGAKVMHLKGITTSSSDEAAIADSWQQIAALSPRGESLTLRVEDATGIYTMRVWVNGSAQVLPFAPRKARFQVPLVATDPRKYSPVQVLEPVGPAGGADEGLEFPLFDDGYLSFGSFSPTGLQYITNNGTAESWPIFKVRGTLAEGFQIISGADVIEYPVLVGTGEEVMLSPYAGGRATLGGVDVTHRLTQSAWPSILPGETRLYVFLPSGASDSNARLTTIFQDAWW